MDIIPIFTSDFSDPLLIENLKKYANWNFQSAIFLIKNTPIDNAEHLFLEYSAFLGCPYEEKNEAKEIIQSITPNKKEAYEQTSNSSLIELELHIENIWTTSVPDWVWLMCVHNDERADTLIFYPQECIEELKAKHMSIYKYLTEPAYYFLEPESFRKKLWHNSRQKTSLKLYPVLYVNENGTLDINCDFDAIMSDSPEHIHAVKYFYSFIYPKYVRKICLENWDIVFIRNTSWSWRYTSCMHGRSKFEPNAQNPRLLKRIFIAHHTSSHNL